MAEQDINPEQELEEYLKGSHKIIRKIIFKLEKKNF